MSVSIYTCLREIENEKLIWPTSEQNCVDFFGKAVGKYLTTESRIINFQISQSNKNIFKKSNQSTHGILLCGCELYTWKITFQWHVM
jgi:hypothetical protein